MSETEVADIFKRRQPLCAPCTKTDKCCSPLPAVVETSVLENGDQVTIYREYYCGPLSWIGTCFCPFGLLGFWCNMDEQYVKFTKDKSGAYKGSKVVLPDYVEKKKGSPQTTPPAAVTGMIANEAAPVPVPKPIVVPSV